jgi:hypothetical protein
MTLPFSSFRLMDPAAGACGRCAFSSSLPKERVGASDQKKLVHKTTERVIAFSTSRMRGYMGGGVRIPDVAVKRGCSLAG